MLQGTPDKAGDTTRLEYLLNFLGPIRQTKHEQWNPCVATADVQPLTGRTDVTPRRSGRVSKAPQCLIEHM